jgi:hypothetical protein
MNRLSQTEYGNTCIVCGTLAAAVCRGRNEFAVSGLNIAKPVLRATIALRAGKDEETWTTYALESLLADRVTFTATDTFAAGADAILAIDFAG